MFLVLADAVDFRFCEGDGTLARGDEGGVDPKPKKSFCGLAVEELKFDVALHDESVALERWNEVRFNTLLIASDVKQRFVFSCYAQKRFPLRQRFTVLIFG